jgi:hypothetical protein
MSTYGPIQPITVAISSVCTFLSLGHWDLGLNPIGDVNVRGFFFVYPCVGRDLARADLRPTVPTEYL